MLGDVIIGNKCLMRNDFPFKVIKYFETFIRGCDFLGTFLIVKTFSIIHRKFVKKKA